MTAFRFLSCVAATFVIACGFSFPVQAATYWNVFNVETNVNPAQFVTYTNQADMLANTNGTLHTPGGSGVTNIVGSGSDGTNYWNVFNVENNVNPAQFVTYTTLGDMLANTNGTLHTPGGSGINNIVGSGSDGTNYWNVFNVETNMNAAQFVTYTSLADMLANTNGTLHTPGGSGVTNIVGSGSDGTSYWNVLNMEGESTSAAQLVTYNSLSDMLANINGTISIPGSANIVGSGATVVPVPAALPLLASALGLLGLAGWRRRRNAQ